LLQTLDECLQPGCRQVLISAPAGFGKTPLMSAWAVWSNAAANRRFLTENSDPRELQKVAKIMAIGLTIAIPLACLRIYLTYAVWILCAPMAARWVRKKYERAI
jgi:ATP/maltotriose-dependent transcriptional regulator MalT